MAEPYRAELTASVPPGPACAWMFDLTDDDYEDPAFLEGALRKERRVLAKEPGRVVVEDRLLGVAVRTTLRRAAEDAIEVEGEAPGLRLRGAVRFEPLDGGAACRIVYDGALEARTALAAALPALRAAYERAWRATEATHVRLMEAEWQRAPWDAEGRPMARAASR